MGANWHNRDSFVVDEGFGFALATAKYGTIWGEPAASDR